VRDRYLVDMSLSQREHLKRGLILVVVGLALVTVQAIIEGGLARFSTIGVLFILLGLLDAAYGKLRKDPGS